MYPRSINLPESHSFFLFGARGTGKTELLKSHFGRIPGETLFLDLLDPTIEGRLSRSPGELTSLLDAHQGRGSWVVIDEVQKIPALLDVVHSQIFKKRFHFALTGSSARKLKRGAANLLAGRAFVFHLFPLTQKELGADFDLLSALEFGTLPEIFSLPTDLDKRRFLKSYAQTYLREEIIAEQIIRSLPPFRRFLDIVGRYTTEIVDYSNIARDIGSDPKTVTRYFEILEDTLLGFFVPSFHRSIRKQQKKSKKFYFFDTGIARVLAGRADAALAPQTFEYGQLFENFIVQEIYRQLSYQEIQFSMSYLRVRESQEIDLLLELGDGRKFAIEIKSSDRDHETHAQSLRQLGRSLPGFHRRILSNDRMEREWDGGIRAMHWERGIAEILGELGPQEI